MRKKILIVFVLIIIGLFFTKKVIGQEKISGDSAKLLKPENLKTNQNNWFFYKQLAIKKILNKYNSPLLDKTDVFIKTCLRYKLDCYLLPAISGIESTFGRSVYSYSYNPFGWGRGYMIFKDWNQAIEAVAKGLKKDYINKDAVNLYQIGRIYAPLSKTWSYRVDFFMKQFYNEELRLRQTEPFL